MTASFELMGLSDALLRGMAAYGVGEPTPLEQRVIRPFLAGRHIHARSPSAHLRGPTFLIPILQRVDLADSACQALVLSPGRELAHANHAVLLQLAQFIPGLTSHCLTGGRPMNEELRALRGAQQGQGLQVVVGTPGRAQSCVEKGALSLSRLKVLVLEEADRLIDTGFMDMILDIFRVAGLPDNVQLAYFQHSALPAEGAFLTRLLRNPLMVGH